LDPVPVGQVPTRLAAGGLTAADYSPPPEAKPVHLEKTMSWSGVGPPPAPLTAPSQDHAAASAAHEDQPELTAFLAPAQAPDELGRMGCYRVLKVLGAGGMGVVFLAEDLVLNRPVAIKAMLPAVASKPINRQRFLREAQAMAKVKNEHVITIYQVGVDRGVPYLAMEFLEGEPLDHRLCRENRLPFMDAVRIGRQTAEGLASAHERGLIHRDIKPGNLWLVKPRGRVVILDFGLARAADEDNSLTRTGIILGTPSYMSPEQARSQPLDPRSDLFSLGVVLYRMVAGRLPFTGPDAFAVLAALALEEPRAVWEVNPDVPWPLAKLIMQLMAKNPDERPTTAHEVAHALAAVEDELRNPPELFTPARPVAAARTAPAAPSSLDLAQVDLAADDDAVEVDDLEILPDDAALGIPAPLLSPKRLHELTGHCLGAYEIGPVVGQGHHGVVFRARDARTSQVVALKVLFPDFPDNDAETQQFTRAMSTALALSHPNLVALYAAGKTGPYCWMAQQYVEGKSLAQIIQELDHAPRISWQLGLRVTYHIARALEFTRPHKLIHGNITPKNILIRASDQAAFLNDLRLLKALKDSKLQESVLDQKLIAERTFLAPELADGGKSYVDFLCDLYSLGAIVYHVVTGQPIFESKTLEEALAAIRTRTPVRPRKHQKAIPRDFEVVIMRLLAKHQEDRYQSPAEVLADLDPIVKSHGLQM
jgi:serine/threonine protein kinase